MFCPNCGAQNPDGAAFCGSCGASLAAPQQSAQPVQQPVQQPQYQQTQYQQPQYQQPQMQQPYQQSAYQQPMQQPYQQPQMAEQWQQPKKKKSKLVSYLILLAVAVVLYFVLKGVFGSMGNKNKNKGDPTNSGVTHSLLDLGAACGETPADFGEENEIVLRL